MGSFKNYSHHKNDKVDQLNHEIITRFPENVITLRNINSLAEENQVIPQNIKIP